jgi:hypothetical protein
LNCAVSVTGTTTWAAEFGNLARPANNNSNRAAPEFPGRPSVSDWENEPVQPKRRPSAVKV